MPPFLSTTSQRQRAIGAEDKETRRHAILDAADRLLARYPDRLPNVADVAIEAELAKGTVYLYFPSKEEMLLALHERHVGNFFVALYTLLDSTAELTIDDMLALADRHMVQPPTFLPLASLCFGVMEKSIPQEAQRKHYLRIADLVGKGAVGIERHFPRLRPGQGSALLMHSYALIVGLWQMTQPGRLPEALHGQPELAMFERDYKTELDRALRALWHGHIHGAAEPPVSPLPARPPKIARRPSQPRGKTARQPRRNA